MQTHLTMAAPLFKLCAIFSVILVVTQAEKRVGCLTCSENCDNPIWKECDSSKLASLEDSWECFSQHVYGTLTQRGCAAKSENTCKYEHPRSQVKCDLQEPDYKKDGDKKTEGDQKPEGDKKPKSYQKTDDNKKPESDKKPEGGNKPEGGKDPQGNQDTTTEIPTTTEPSKAANFVLSAVLLIGSMIAPTWL